MQRQLKSKKSKKYRFKLGLYQDYFYPEYKALILDHPNDDAGLRISNRKASGKWKTIEIFECCLTIADLKKYQIKD